MSGVRAGIEVRNGKDWEKPEISWDPRWVRYSAGSLKQVRILGARGQSGFERCDMRLSQLRRKALSGWGPSGT